MRLLAAIVAALVLAAGCGDGSDDGQTAETAPAEAAVDDSESTATTASASTAAEPTAADTGDGEELFPDVLEATAQQDGDGTWTFAATLSSPYDTADRYADAWRVVGPDGTVYGIRELLHDHAAEQPFTRSQSGIEIPDDVDVVTVEGRDQISGWGGATVEVQLER